MSGKCVLGPLLCGGRSAATTESPLPSPVEVGGQRVRSYVASLRYAMQQGNLGEVVEALDALRRATENDGPSDIENRKVAGTAGVIGALCTLLSEGEVHPRVLEAALAALRFITKGDGTNIQLATSSGAVALTIEAMRRHPGEGAIQRYACMAIRSLTFNHPDNQREVVEKGAAALVVAAMKHHQCDPSIQAAACMAIQNMTWLVAENRITVEQSGAIQRIVTAMTLFPDDADVQRWGCGALQNLACSDQCTAKFMEMGLPVLVLAAMRRFDDDAMLQNYALGVCRNISYTKDYRPHMAKSGAIELAWRAMCNHRDDEEIQSSACAFFFNTVIELPENGRLVIECRSALGILGHVMRRHARNDALSKKFQGLLKLIGRDSTRVVPDVDMPCMTLQELCMRAVADHLPDPPAIELPPRLAVEIVTASQCLNCGRHYFETSFAAAVKVEKTWIVEVFCSRACAVEMYAPPPPPIASAAVGDAVVPKTSPRPSSVQVVAGSSPVHSLLDGGLPQYMRGMAALSHSGARSSDAGSSSDHASAEGDSSGMEVDDAERTRRPRAVNPTTRTGIEIPDFLGPPPGAMSSESGPSSRADPLFDALQQGLSDGTLSEDAEGDEDEGYVRVDADEAELIEMVPLGNPRARQSSIVDRFGRLASRFAVGRRDTSAGSSESSVVPDAMDSQQLSASPSNGPSQGEWRGDRPLGKRAASATPKCVEKMRKARKLC